MIEIAAEILEMSQTAIWQVFVVFLRVGAVVSLLPIFGERSIPVRVKLGLAVAFTLIVAPAAPTLPMREGFDVLPIIGAETVTGLFFGMMLRLFIIALQIAGTIGAQATSLSQLFGGSAGSDPQPAMGHVLVISGLALAALMGLHVRAAEYLIYSYELVEMGRIIPADVVSSAGLAGISRTFALGFTLAAPFVVASLIYNVTLGVINKAMPQLMVAFVGAPAITAGGLMLLMLAAPIILSVWSSAFLSFINAPFSGAP